MYLHSYQIDLCIFGREIGFCLGSIRTVACLAVVSPIFDASLSSLLLSNF